jgi:arginyl-tRNA synthetase
MNVFSAIERLVVAQLTALAAEGAIPAGLDFAAVAVETPREASHGDLSTNAAMVLAKAARLKPRDIADKLVGKLRADPRITKAEVAGPGFINLTLDVRLWQDQIAEILREGASYGRLNAGKGGQVNVEYVSANPTGPMHVGHCRNAVVGDAIANLLDFAGYDVTREYYINDAGGQVDTLARSAFLRYREALGEQIGAIPEGLYPGDYLKPVGAALAKAHGRALLDQTEATWLPEVRAIAVASMLAMIRDDLARLGIKHDVFFSERSLTSGTSDLVAQTIAWLQSRELVYTGTLPPPKGEAIEDWEDRPQTLFRSTKFGDDMDRALKKSDGGYTYFASDMAYHQDKLNRGFTHLVNVLGADHSGYAKRIKAAVSALSEGRAELDVQFYQFVKLMQNGEPLTMSKRSGTFITLRDVVEEVGRDAVRFMMLYRKNDAALDFDFAKVTEQSKDNPVFYVQYAHARASSVFRNVKASFPELDLTTARAADLSSLADPVEIDLVKQLAAFPKIAHTAARAHEPHRLAFYLFDVASSFHQLWARGNDSPHLRFIQPNNQASTTARLALIGATQQVISSGLAVLGVDAPQEMR